GYNKEVVCFKEACPSTNGCHVVLYEQREKCCDVCKGCGFNGTHHQSTSEWTEPDDPCVRYTCDAGVITLTRVHCHMPCVDPVPPLPGECCPACPSTSVALRPPSSPAGCIFNETPLQEGDIVYLDHDRCVTCVCQGGNVVCSKRACPILSCPPIKATLKPGACCPECKGSRKIYEITNKCLIGNKVYKSGHKFQLDECTQCECQASTSVCERETCPPILCSESELVKEEGACCHTCRRQEPKGTCISAGIEHKDRSIWKLDACTTCSCQLGDVRCYVEQCRPSDECPPGTRLQTPADQCCPRCVEDAKFPLSDEAVCTVFGDPHYRTFDGRVFNFQGTCKYVLTEDCKEKSFSVRVRNDARSSRSFSWTKTVFLKMNQLKVTLEQYKQVRINGKHVSLPYQHEMVNITEEGFSVLVKTALDVKVLWDGDSFLEISVPPSYQRHLCGLCGNYNHQPNDDLRTRKGNIVGEGDSVEFGRSWRVGSLKQCSRPERLPVRDPVCLLRWDVRIRAVRHCNALKSVVFVKCHRRVNPVLSCLLDMCECPEKRRCYCEALTAYAHECARAGIQLSWRNETDCLAVTCPRGAVYTNCAPSCAQTCFDAPQNTELCSKPCAPGCLCPPKTVLHRGRCIKPHRYKPNSTDTIRGLKCQLKEENYNNPDMDFGLRTSSDQGT
uniref:BMP-binding endothelial regulator protein n=1 Tax=Strigamia maritima TaxID=126957 RepID=T1IP83_STRMM